MHFLNWVKERPGIRSDSHWNEVNSHNSRSLGGTKKKIYLSAGISLISAPYWWNGTKDSLLSIIQQQSPTPSYSTENQTRAETPSRSLDSTNLPPFDIDTTILQHVKYLSILLPWDESSVVPQKEVFIFSWSPPIL